MALVARTRHWYLLPAVSSVTVRGLESPDAARVVPPLVLRHSVRYPVIGRPPFVDGARNVTLALVDVDHTGDTSRGAPGATRAAFTQAL